MDLNKTGQLNTFRFLSEVIEPIKQLRKFEKKHHRIPEAATENDLRFLATITHDDIEDDLQSTFSKVRSAFELKRKQLSVSGPDDRGGLIETPFFNYEIFVTLSAENPANVAWQRSITEVNDPSKIFTREFHQAFGNQFSLLEMSTTKPLDLESIVDHIEEEEPDSLAVDYDKDVSWCTISVRRNGVKVTLKADSIRVGCRHEISPQELLQAFLDVQQQFIADLYQNGNPFGA